MTGEFADDFLQNILQCHKALNFAVFIDHQRHAPLILLKQRQLLQQWRAFRNEVRLTHDFLERFLIERLLARRAQDFAHVYQANHVRQIAVEHHHPGMVRGGETVANVVDPVGNVHALDQCARRHRVVNGHAFKVKQIDHDVLVFFRNELAALKHQRAHFLHRQLRVALLQWFDTHQLQQKLNK